MLEIILVQDFCQLKIIVTGTQYYFQMNFVLKFHGSYVPTLKHPLQ